MNIIHVLGLAWLSRRPIARLFDGLTDQLENSDGKSGSGSAQSDDSMRF